MRVFKNLIIGLLFLSFNIFAGGDKTAIKNKIYIQDNKLNAELVNYSLRNIIKDVEKYLNVKIFMYSNVKEKYYTVKFNNWTTDKFLSFIIKDLSYYKTKNHLFIMHSNKKGYINSENIDYANTDFNFDARTTYFTKAKKMNIDILEIPQIKSLIKLSNLQKQKDLLYQRIVNPKNPSDTYDFKVRYDLQHEMMIPFERNGKAESQKAEGFINFTTVANSIIAKQKKLEAYKYNDDVYLKFKNKKLKETFMLVSGNSSNMEVMQNIGTKGLPNLKSYLVGNSDSFTILAKIQHPEGQIILRDIVISQ